MAEPIFENFSVGVKTARFLETVKTECKTGLSVQKIKEILSVSAWVEVGEVSSQNSVVKSTLKTSFFICYIASAFYFTGTVIPCSEKNLAAPG